MKIFDVYPLKDAFCMQFYTFEPVSLNTYKKMHFGAVKRLKQNYRSVIDAVIIKSIPNNLWSLHNDGVKLDMPLFNVVDVVWVLSFKNSRERDIGNYTQKILQDAIVESGIIKDDSSKYVKSDKVLFSSNTDGFIFVGLIGEYRNRNQITTMISNFDTFVGAVI